MQRILLCLDTDPQPSVFDSIVALDSDVNQLLRHGGVKPADVEGLVHGVMFTRGSADLRHSAVFIGGSDVQIGEQVLQSVLNTFFGGVRVSVMLDSSGANTTAAAAVVTAGKHLPLGPETIALVLGGTGPVGQRVVRQLAREGAEVRVASRKITHAEAVCHRITATVPEARLSPRSTTDSEMSSLVDGAQLLISAGAAGIELMDETTRQAAGALKVAIDLNAVPPAGIGGIKPQDRAVDRNGQICHGALSVGGLKMKIHKAAIRRLFETNNHVFDADELYSLGKYLASVK